MDLQEFLYRHGSKNIERDLRILNTLCSETMRLKWERMAKNISQAHVSLTIAPGGGSYSRPLPKGGFQIVIDPCMTYQPESTLEAMQLRCQGILAHEAGHLLFSDFEIVRRNREREFTAKAMIPIEGKRIQDGVGSANVLRQHIFDYIYWNSMSIMLNSIEDAAVERGVSRDAPRMYGSIVAMRDFLVNYERENLTENQEGNNLHLLMTDIRHIATYAYRNENFQPMFLSDYFSKKEQDEIYVLSLYSRYGKNTEERYVSSQVLLDKLKPVLNEKVDKFTSQYLMGLMMSNGKMDNLLENMSRDLEKQHTEVMLNSMNPDLNNAPQDITSDYDMDLPDILEEQLKQKKQMEQERKENNSSSASSGSNSSQSKSDSQSSSEGDSSQNESSESDSSDSSSGENTEGTSSMQGEEQESQEENGSGSASDEQSKTDEGKNSSNEDTSENGNGTGGEKDDEMSDENANSAGSSEEDAGEMSEETAENAEGMSGKSSKNEDDSDASVMNSADKLREQAKNERLEADNAFRDSVNKISKELQRESEKNLEDAIEKKRGGNGKAPSLEDSLGDTGSLSNLHDGISCTYHPSKSFKEFSSSGAEVRAHRSLELKKQANDFSKQLKEALMFRAKTRRKNGLKSGKLNDAALSRIITDQRVFRKKINGIEKKARIEVLLDLSGSMYGEKVRDAIAASFMLAEACAKIKTPISVMGHDSSHHVNLYHFLDFEHYLNKEAREKIFCAEAGGSNRDGFAIIQASTDLVRHRKKDEELILMVISDGAPADYGYGGDSAFKDIQNITHLFEKQYNVKTIGIGIGSDTLHIPDIYENFVIVPDVSRLGNELLRLLKNILY